MARPTPWPPPATPWASAPFLAVNGDNYYPVDAIAAVSRHPSVTDRPRRMKQCEGDARAVRTQYPTPDAECRTPDEFLESAASHAMGGFDPESLVEGGNIPRDRLPRFAFAWADAAGLMQRFVEKPEVSPLGDPNAKVSMNLWRFGPRIFDACARVTPSVRGELELVDAVRMLPEAFGEPVSVVPVRGPVLDLSSRADIVAVEQMLASREVRL